MIPTTSKPTWDSSPSTPAAETAKKPHASERSAVIWRSSARSVIVAGAAAAAGCWCFALPAPRPVIAEHAKPKNAQVTCATCHNGVATSYATAPMRHAMEPQGANPALNAHTDLSLQIGSYTYRVQTKDGQSTYSVSDGTDTLTLPIHWIFGQHAQTWVLEKDGHYYESLVSYFPRANGLAITPGDQKITPHNLTEAMGRQLPIWETRTCFNCHGSGVTAKRKTCSSKSHSRPRLRALPCGCAAAHGRCRTGQLQDASQITQEVLMPSRFLTFAASVIARGIP